MIDHKLLTPENGFEDGVVVEIVWAQSVPHRMELAYWEDAKEWSTEYMEFIRPLTGPMSIWNHAPVWAVAIEDGPGTIIWMDEDAMDCDDSFKWTKRPFWATRSGE